MSNLWMKWNWEKFYQTTLKVSLHLGQCGQVHFSSSKFGMTLLRTSNMDFKQSMWYLKRLHEGHVTISSFPPHAYSHPLNTFFKILEFSPVTFKNPLNNLGVHRESVNSPEQCCGLDQHRVFFEILDGNIEIIEDPFTDLLSDDGHPETIFPYVDDCVKNVLFWRHGGWEIGSLCFWLVEHFTEDFVTSMTCIKFTRKMNFIRIVSFVSFPFLSIYHGK